MSLTAGSTGAAAAALGGRTSHGRKVDEVLGLGTGLPTRVEQSPPRKVSPEKRSQDSPTLALSPEEFKQTAWGIPKDDCGRRHSPGALAPRLKPALTRKRTLKGAERLRSVARRKGLSVSIPPRRIGLDARREHRAKSQRHDHVPGLLTRLPTRTARGRRKGAGSRLQRVATKTRAKGLRLLTSSRSVRISSFSLNRSLSSHCSSLNISQNRSRAPSLGRDRWAQMPHTPVTPWRKWIIIRHGDDPEETDANVEIGLGAIKAQIPLAMPGTKPIIITHPQAHVPQSPSSALAFSFAISLAFPLTFKLSREHEALLPVALSFQLSLSLLPLLAGVGKSVAQSALQVNVGQMEAEIPFCLPIPHHLPALMATFAPHVTLA